MLDTAIVVLPKSIEKLIGLNYIETTERKHEPREAIASCTPHLLPAFHHIFKIS